LLVPWVQRARLGAVPGYLAAGMLIGPYGLGLAGETNATMEIAEFGVVLLLADIKPFKGFLTGPIAPEKTDARVNPPAKGRESPDS